MPQYRHKQPKRSYNVSNNRTILFAIGIKSRLIDYSNLFSEKGKDIFICLKTAWETWNICNKISSFGGDNCKTNFGNVNREGGKLNVFTRLKEELGDNLVGVGCTAHILHNAPQDACLSVLPFDIQHILVLIYKQFYSSTKQTEALKRFCDEMSVEYSKVKGCPSTRFLAKKNSIISVLKVYGPLMEYFLDPKPTAKVVDPKPTANPSCSVLVSELALQAWGHGFDSHRYQKSFLFKISLVLSMVL